MTPSAAYRLKLGLVGAFGVGALAFTGALALASVRPDLRAPGLTALGVGAEARADRLAIAAATTGGVAQALTANREALNAAPMTAAAWLRIAWLRAQNGARLDSRSLEAMEKAYSVAPFGPDVTTWRLAFVYDHWSDLTPALRKDATAEHYETALRRPARLDTAAIADPSGRLAATLTEARAAAERAKRRQARNPARAATKT